MADKLADLLATVADQLRGQNDAATVALAAHSARMRESADSVVRQDIARQVRNLYGGVGGLADTVVRRDGGIDVAATRKLDAVLKDLLKAVIDQLDPADNAGSLSQGEAQRYRVVRGAGLRTSFTPAPSVTVRTTPDDCTTLVIEFPAEPGVGGRTTRLTFDDVVEYGFVDYSFLHFHGNRDAHDLRLIEVLGSEHLAAHYRSRTGAKGEFAARLRHFRIGFDEHGYYDVLCAGVRIESMLGDQPDPGVELAGLTPRAVEFLRLYATRRMLHHDLAKEARDAERAAEQSGLPVDTVMTKLAYLQRRFGGLRYESPSWSFEETIGFAAVLDLDDEDTEPMVILIEHTAAHPFGVWATLDGGVHFMYPGDHGGEYVHVFDRIEAVIESDALMAECAEWIEVSRGGGDTIDLMETKVSALSRIDEASGHTESWWLGDGFRVHVSRTMGRVFGLSGDGRWAIWAESEAAVERARAFLSA
jgi:hypothetical protein